MRLLHIDSSALGEASASRSLTAAIVERWRLQVPGLQVTRLDLDAEPLPHLSAASLAGSSSEEAARGARALRDFQAADVVVIGAPMYNFGIPSTLKAWIDRVAVAGKTFRYTASGPEGLAGGKRVIVAATRGGIYPAGAPGEFVETYLRHVFGFLGIDTVSFVRAEGLAISKERREQSIAAACAAIETVIPIPKVA